MGRFFVGERLWFCVWGRNGLKRKVITVPLIFLFLARDHEIMQGEGTRVIRGVDRLEGVEAKCVDGWKRGREARMAIRAGRGRRGGGGVRRTRRWGRWRWQEGRSRGRRGCGGGSGGGRGRNGGGKGVGRRGVDRVKDQRTRGLDVVHSKGGPPGKGMGIGQDGDEGRDGLKGATGGIGGLGVRGEVRGRVLPEGVEGEPVIVPMA